MYRTMFRRYYTTQCQLYGDCASDNTDKNNGMNKYGTRPQKFTQAHVPQNMKRVDGKHVGLPTKLKRIL
jgi:hypothetical protein